MIKQLFKTVLFVVLVVPIGLGAMEGDPDKIELGKELIKAAECLDWNIVKKLINQQADVNQKVVNGWSALMCAAFACNEEIVQRLINSGADLNQKNDGGWTAFMIVSNRFGRDTLLTCRILIDAMLAQNKEQKSRIYTVLLCIKQMPGFRNTNQARDLFKPLLLPTLTDVRQEINRITNETLRNQLLEKYGFQQATK